MAEIPNPMLHRDGLTLRVGRCIKLNKRCIHLVALAHIVGWVERDVGTIYVGFADLKAPPKFEIETKVTNPTRLRTYPG